MANTRAIRASKRQRTDQRTYRDRLVLPDDFEVIHSRQSSLTSTRRIPVETQRSPQRGRTAWLFGDSWAPEDSTEVGLEPDWSWCDAAFEGPVTEVLPATNKSKGKAKKPVSNALLILTVVCTNSMTAPSASDLEGAVPSALPRRDAEVGGKGGRPHAEGLSGLRCTQGQPSGRTRVSLPRLFSPRPRLLWLLRQAPP